MTTQVLNAAGFSDVLYLAPGQSATVLVESTDSDELDNARVSLETSPNQGGVWNQGIGYLAAGDTQSLSQEFVNEGTAPLLVRVAVYELDTITGSVTITITRPEDTTPPLVADQPDNVIVVPTYADNAAAVAGGLPLGALYTDGVGGVAAVTA